MGGGDKLLPELRADLQVVHASERAGFMVFDPPRQRYFRIDEVTAKLLALWPRCRTAQELTSAASRSALAIGEAEVTALTSFLLSNQLVTSRERDAWRRLAGVERHRRGSGLGWLVHNYLFVRIPLVNPQRQLDIWSPRLSFLFSRTFAVSVALIGAAGLYLVSRQWSAFLATFTDFLSIEGAIAFAVSMVVVKSLHELGHALTAARFGCRVPSMGVCFMVLTPMLYTDVSDSWRLTSRRKRLAIDAAGLTAELAVACIALFLWAFLPDGTARSIAFVLATTSLLISIGLNANPLMRFDGYYILSDVTGIENLQPRAFDVGVWRLRELLFALGRPPPEPMSRRYLRALALYAYATWIYRLLLFTAIAVMVYGIGFKLLGITLFLIEIVFFIGRPIMTELKVWYALRTEIVKRRRGVFVAGAAFVSLLACFIPWSTTMRLPALLDDRDVAHLYPRRAAMVTALHVGEHGTLPAGAPIVSLKSPDIDHDIALTELRIAATTMRLRRRAGSAEDLGETLTLQQTLAALASRLEGLKRERAELDVTMPFPGVVSELGRPLHVGRWLQRSDLVSVVIGGSHCRIRGYVSEDQVARLDLNAPARFVSEDLRRETRPVIGLDVATAGTDALDMPDLASHYGGAVAARVVTRSRQEPAVLVPVVGQFLLSGSVEGACGSTRVQRGTLHLSARAESVAARVWRQVLKVLVRESGV